MLESTAIRREEVQGGCWKLRNEELGDLYSSPNTIRVLTSRKMRWAEHVTGTGRIEMHIQFWLENPKGRDTEGH